MSRRIAFEREFLAIEVDGGFVEKTIVGRAPACDGGRIPWKAWIS